jgi:hypothetical protein
VTSPPVANLRWDDQLDELGLVLEAGRGREVFEPLELPLALLVFLLLLLALHLWTRAALSLRTAIGCRAQGFPV